MANRTIQFKRNHSISSSASVARQAILNMASSLHDGEFVINSYVDSNARNGVAEIVAVKAQGQIFFVDNQVILNKLGIYDDGTINPNIEGGIESVVSALTEDMAAISGDVEDLASEVSGLSTDVETLGGKVDALDTAVTSLSGDVETMDGKVDALDTAVTSLSGDVEDLAGDVETVSGKVNTIETNLEALSGTVEDLASDVETVSGKVETLATSVETVSGDVITLGGKVETLSGEVVTLTTNVNTLSGKSVTAVEDSATVDLTISDNTADGTKKIKADVNISAAQGNILSAASDGIFTSVDYNSVSNALVINGIEKPLNAGSIINSITYSGETESLVINYTDMSGTTHDVVAPLGDLIEEYTYPNADENHNIQFEVTRNVSGATEIQADVNLIDCGEYGEEP